MVASETESIVYVVFCDAALMNGRTSNSASSTAMMAGPIAVVSGFFLSFLSLMYVTLDGAWVK